MAVHPGGRGPILTTQGSLGGLLPAYPPELNPVEGVWSHMKRGHREEATQADSVPA
jgi:hypothetical protein